MALLRSVNVGLPRDIRWRGRTVHTGIMKSPVGGAATVRRLNIDGDGQGDLGGHGGEQRAVFVYQLNSYAYWEKLLGRTDFSPGQFGENFHDRGPAGRRGTHRRPLPRRHGAVRGVAAAERIHTEVFGARAGLLAGEVTATIDPVDPPAEGNVLICTTRPRGDVVLDL
ncbi:MOSC domain-containing protein [Symbioplanes lichenis]|uniref:MOSC domain-containing protein n=1 Tax=Symbioplanes lichenis TaxID=1629072 RepID=UPI00273921A3|nr:MOSC domain-containing protein [Actinoplanes lichenis]